MIFAADVLFYGKRHPREMNVAEIEAFLNHLATDANVAASTQNQALTALLFLYREVLQTDLKRPVDALHTRKPKRLPTVLTKEEVLQIIGRLSGVLQLMAELMQFHTPRLRLPRSAIHSRRRPAGAPAGCRHLMGHWADSLACAPLAYRCPRQPARRASRSAAGALAMRAGSCTACACL
jgi:hypothetical protein